MNPHSAYLLYEENLGVVIFLFIYIAIKVFLTRDCFEIFIVSAILIYFAANYTILFPRVNPIVIFILLLYIVKIIDKNRGYYYVEKFSN